LCGEKYLQRIKPLIHGVRPGDGWLKSTMEKIYEYETLSWITECYDNEIQQTKDDSDHDDDDDEEESDGEEEGYKRYNPFRITKSLQVLEDTLATRLRPISGFVVKSPDGEDVMVVPYMVRRPTLGYRVVTFDLRGGGEKVGVWYAPVAFKDPDLLLTLPETRWAVPSVSVRSFILLPGKQGHYCAIADDWTERKETGEFSLLYGITESLFGDMSLEH
jgi:hypothetical protein